VGKVVVEVAVVQKTLNEFRQTRPSEFLPPGKMLIIDPDKCLKTVFHIAVIIKRLWAP
jgi:hypothetical protein